MRFASALFLTALLGTGPAFAADAAKGKAKYDLFCTACHGATGKGDGAAAAALNPKPRDFTNAAEMSTLTDDYLKAIIAKGGAANGKSPIMQPWGAQLPGEELDNMVAYIRTMAVKP